MVLTTEQIQRITCEATLGVESTVEGEEAAAFRKKVEANIAAIKAAGQIVDIPKEW